MLEKQSELIELPLYQARVSKSDSIEDYANKMEKYFLDCSCKYKSTTMAYGDIFLEELKEYRIENRSCPVESGYRYAAIQRDKKNHLPL